MFSVTQESGRCGLAAQEGLLTLGQCYFHPFVPAALLMLSHMCFFALKLRVSILHAPGLVEWGPAFMA